MGIAALHDRMARRGQRPVEPGGNPPVRVVDPQHRRVARAQEVSGGDAIRAIGDDHLDPAGIVL